MEKKGESSRFRFLSFTNDDEEKEKTAKLQEAARKIEEAIGLEKDSDGLIEYDPSEFRSGSEYDPKTDNRSLYERLQEQRDKKQEAYDESMKFSNQIACLDEDDIEYLEDLKKQKLEDELRKRLQQQDKRREEIKLEAERKLVEEAKLKEALKRDKLGFGINKKSTIVKPSLLSKIKVKPKSKLIASVKNKSKDDKS